MPPPPTGTTIAVQVIPYSGYGCLDTFYAQLLDTLTVQARARPTVCPATGEAVQIGSPPRPGLVCLPVVAGRRAVEPGYFESTPIRLLPPPICG